LVPGFAKRYFVNRKLRQLGDIERLLAAELPQLLARENQARPAASATTDGRRAFQSVARVAHLLGYSLLGKLQGEFREGRWLEVLQTAASMGAVTLGVVPYLAAFATQHKDDGLLAAVAARFPRARPALTDGGKAWLTDTWGETDNDALAVEAVAAEAAVAGRRLTCVTCRDGVPPTAMRLHNFAPVGELELPECDRPRLWFPPFLETIEWLEQQGFHELIVATPGPLGMAGLGAAKLLGLSVSGVYQTDLPRHVGQITRDPAMEELTWKFLRWFYGQMDRVLVPSECYRRHLAANGFDRQRLRVAGHGVDPQQFQPGRRDPRFNARWGLRGAFTFLFAGRVAAETNIELLLGEFARLRSTLPQVNLAVVGDGPLLDALRSRYRGLHVAFTGPLRGEALATAYASADALVVPSRTLRFAPAVLEAQAAGLPAIVSDWGDPRDIVEQGGSGMMVNVQCPGALASAMHRMATHPAEHAHWRRAATAHAHRHTWRRVVERIWADEPPAPPPCDRGAPESVAELIALDVA
jgi:glycosyltransferase involved in cell wall biosynthesis